MQPKQWMLITIHTRLAHVYHTISEKQFHPPKGKLVRHLFLTDEGKKKIKQIHYERVLCLTVQWYMQ